MWRVRNRILAVQLLGAAGGGEDPVQAYLVSTRITFGFLSAGHLVELIKRRHQRLGLPIAEVDHWVRRMLRRPHGLLGFDRLPRPLVGVLVCALRRRACRAIAGALRTRAIS